MVTRTEALIQIEIDGIQQGAATEGRTLSQDERSRLDDLIVQRAAAERASDEQWRRDYAREQRVYWRRHETAKLRSALRPSPIFLGLLGATGISGFLLASSPSERLVQPLTILFILSAWIASVCLHEFGHALTAYLGGDHEVVERGYLRLDPLAYTNPLLSIALPIGFLLMGGIGLPGGSVLVNDHRLRSRRWVLAVDAGGPVGSLLCLLLAGLPFLIGGDRWITEGNLYFWAALAGFVKLQAVVLILNLLPVPPLDGFRIACHWLGDDVRMRGLALGWMPMLLVYIVLGSSGPIADVFWTAGDALSGLFRLPWGYGEWAIGQLSLRM